MAVLLGEQGKVELRRSNAARGEKFEAFVANSDINVSRKRLVFTKLGTPSGILPLVTGDRIEMVHRDKYFGYTLRFLEGYESKAKFVGYVHVDNAGGVYFFHNYVSAVNNTADDRIGLVKNLYTEADVIIRLQGTAYKLLGQVVSYELNTEREAVDTTALSDDFRRSTSGLISGNGRLTAFFDYKVNSGDPAYSATASELIELPYFISQLVLRTELGSEFLGRFYVVPEGPKPYGTADANADLIFYECTARITSAALNFAAGAAIELVADFVTTGTIKLKTQDDIGRGITTFSGDTLSLGQYQETGAGTLLTDF